MFKNYFKVAVPTISRQRGYAFINIAGLAIGMASFIIIMLWVDNELSYDRFHEHHERIYRVLLYYPEDNGTIIGVIEDYYFSSLHYAVEPLILAIVPYWYSDVYIRISSQDISTTISYIEKRIKELAPDYLFNYRFLDEEIAHLYNTDQQGGKLI